MNHTYGQHEWHSEYQKLCKKRDTQSLYYVIADCRDVIECNPENPKCAQYSDEIHYCAMELNQRRYRHGK